MPLEMWVCHKPVDNIQANTSTPVLRRVDNISSFKSSLSSDRAMSDQVNSFKLKPAHQKRTIDQLNNAAGSDMLLALSDLYDEQLAGLGADFFKNEHKSMLGASVGAMGNRLSALQRTIKDYQLALEEVRKAWQNKVPKFERTKIENRARAIHKRLNTEFADEIQKRLAKSRARKNNIWINSDRGINLARSSRSNKPIQISTARELRQLNRFAGVAKFAGRGLILLDMHSRATKVHSTYKSGGNWDKQAIQETVGFSFGTAAGAAASNTVYGIATGIALAFTPAGWALVIGVGAAAIAGFATGYAGDKFGKWATHIAYEAGNQLSMAY